MFTESKAMKLRHKSNKMKTYLYLADEDRGEWKLVSKRPISRIEFEFDKKTGKPKFCLFMSNVEKFVNDCKVAGVHAAATNVAWLEADQHILFQPLPPND